MSLHRYLRAIGFQELKNTKELDEILDEVIDSPNRVVSARDSEGNEIAELTREYGHGFGIRIVGQFLEDEESFEIDYYYPYFSGSGVTTQEQADVERHAGNESYAGICDDLKLGIALIFYVQNVNEYLNEKLLNENCLQGSTVTLSALSTEGKIIMPIRKESKKVETPAQMQQRNSLVAAARDGDEEAIENLTLEDIDTYSMISRRIVNEDVLSIVESTLMPYGVESDQYAVIGEIIDYTMLPNKRTLEELYVLTIKTNDLVFDVIINQKDLLGEPAIGRRFKGTVWLQGKINFMSM